MFRRVIIPDNIHGRLYLSAMPGRFEPIQNFESRLDLLNITHIVCLAQYEEISEYSQAYYRLLMTNFNSREIEYFPIPDFGVPNDREGFLDLAVSMADALRSGDNILVHCAAGIGRTGTFAQVLLLALGMERHDAAAAVRMADARPEGMNQQDLIDWCVQKFNKTRLSL